MITTEAIQLFSALLALAVLAASTAMIGLASMRSTRAAVRGWTSGLAAHRSLFVAVIASASTLGSLYFSEVANYVPCTLCWYQRIAMYSIAIISITAVIRRDSPIAYVVVLAAIGAPISVYHWLLERIPDLESGACSATVPCNLVWFEKFGFVTLPFMAFAGFTSILTICLTLRKDTP